MPEYIERLEEVLRTRVEVAREVEETLPPELLVRHDDLFGRSGTAGVLTAHMEDEASRRLEALERDRRRASIRS